MVSKRIHIGVPVLALVLVIAPFVIPGVHAVTYSFKPDPSRTFETSVNSATAVALLLNVSQATLATTYQFQWVVTDPSGASKNHSNQTVATSASFQISLQYPRDFGTNMILAGNYSVVINQMMPAGASNPVQTGQFTVGLTDKLAYQRTNTVQVKAAGYGNGETVTLNFTRGTTTYSIPTTADGTGQVSTSWTIPVNAPIGVWTLLLKGASTNKPVPDRQTFTINPLNVTLPSLTTSPAVVRRTEIESVSFTANYQGGAVVQTGSARLRLTPPNGASIFTSAIYNSTIAAFQSTYSFPSNSQTGSWVAAVDPGMFNDSYGNMGPASIVQTTFTVWPTNVTISRLTLSQIALQRTQTQSLSFSANYLTGVRVQTGLDNIRLIETDGTTYISTTASYNSAAGLFQATTTIPVNAQTGAWVASVDPNSFNDGYGNGGPTSSVVRAFTVQSATITLAVTIYNTTYGVGSVVPIYAAATYPDGSAMTNGTVTVNFTTGRNQTGKPVTLSYVQGQSRWAGSYIVSSKDLSGLWVATVSATDLYGNTGLQTQFLVVNVPPTGQTSTPQSLDLYWFILALVVGSGSSSLLLLRRVNVVDQPFERLFSMTSGEFSAATTVMILGDAGSGTSTFGLELIHHQLSSGKAAGLLAYDAFPQEIKRNMKSFGWDVTENLNNGSFKILDCYSALAGIENALIRDPVDFTEISIRVSQMMEGTGTGPYLLVLDSVSPIFNGVKAETTITFLRVLSAKIKSNNGILVLTGSKGSIPETVRSSLDNIVDGVIELNVLREGKKIMRTLTVRRLAGRKTSPVPAEFEIVAGKGIVFRKPRISLKILTPKRKASQF